jgi:hypothetical protein
VRRFGGVPSAEIMGMAWDEFLAELVAACRFEGLDR